MVASKPRLVRADVPGGIATNNQAELVAVRAALTVAAHHARRAAHAGTGVKAGAKA